MKNHTYKYFEWYVAKKDTGPHKRDHRNRSHTFTYNQLGIDKKLIKSEHASEAYILVNYMNNTKEFLREEIKEDKLVRRFDNSVEALTDIWKNKYAKKRLASLKKQDRVSKETHFYDDIIYMTWQETKDKYLNQVGQTKKYRTIRIRFRDNYIE